MRAINQNIAAGLNLKLLKSNFYGVEVELEGYHSLSGLNRRQMEKVNKYWMITHDDSLRQGIEFVSKRLVQTQLIIAMPVLTDAIHRLRLTSSTRCSIHVHVNCLNITWGQMYSFLGLYCFLEPEIFKKFAPSRNENHFCVPLHWNTRLQNMFQRDIGILRELDTSIYKKVTGKRSDGPPFSGDYLYQDGAGPGFAGAPRPTKPQPIRKYLCAIAKHKYSAVSTFRLGDLGTLEFRLLPGTKDMDKILDFVGFLGRLKHLACMYEEPLDLQTLYEHKGKAWIWSQMKVGTLPIADRAAMEDAEEAACKIIGEPSKSSHEFEWNIK